MESNNNKIITRSKNKDKIFYELDDYGNKKRKGSNNIELNIIKKIKKNNNDDSSDDEWLPSDEEDEEIDDTYYDDLIPEHEALSDSRKIKELNPDELEDPLEKIIDALKNKILNKVADKIKETNFDETYEDEYEDEIYDDEEIDDEYEENKTNKKKIEKPLEINETDKLNTIDYEISRRASYDKYFRGLNRDIQEKLIKIEQEIKNFNKNLKPVRYKILELNTSISNKSHILNNVDKYNMMSDNDNEFFKLQKWINGVKLIPFGKSIELPVKLSDPFEKINKFIYKCYNILDQTIYGQINAKNKLIQIISQWISNPKSKTNVLALMGPPGVGKTSLIKDGVSKALVRPFSFIPLGGATDVSTFEGHNYTYEGATWGKIVQCLMNTQCMNPIFFFDELDKIGMSEKGQEVSGLLTHLTDPVQNSLFSDKYFADIDLDISSSFFIFSFNDVHKINPILKDRLTIIQFENYKNEDKVIIAKKYMLPKIIENIGLNKKDFIVDDSIYKHIIINYCNMEKGVRELKRCLTEIILKINMLRFLKQDKENKITLPNSISDMKINFPLKLTQSFVDKLLKNNNYNKMPNFLKHMYS